MNSISNIMYINDKFEEASKLRIYIRNLLTLLVCCLNVCDCWLYCMDGCHRVSSIGMAADTKDYGCNYNYRNNGTCYITSNCTTKNEIKQILLSCCIGLLFKFLANKNKCLIFRFYLFVSNKWKTSKLGLLIIFLYLLFVHI